MNDWVENINLSFDFILTLSHLKVKPKLSEVMQEVYSFKRCFKVLMNLLGSVSNNLS